MLFNDINFSLPLFLVPDKVIIFFPTGDHCLQISLHSFFLQNKFVRYLLTQTTT